MFETRISYLTKKLSDLISSSPYRIDLVAAGSISSPDKQGVYLISVLNERSNFVYVGRIKSRNYQKRFKHHVGLNRKSHLRGMLIINATYPQTIHDYEVRWLNIKDSIERAQLEMFAISVLCPTFNLHG